MADLGQVDRHFERFPTLETGTHRFSKNQHETYKQSILKTVNLANLRRRKSIQPNFKIPEPETIKTFKRSQTVFQKKKIGTKKSISLLNFSESYQEELPDFLDLFVKVISNFSLFLKIKQKKERKELLTIFLRKINWLIFKRKSTLQINE